MKQNIIIYGIYTLSWIPIFKLFADRQNEFTVLSLITLITCVFFVSSLLVYLISQIKLIQRYLALLFVNVMTLLSFEYITIVNKVLSLSDIDISGLIYIIGLVFVGMVLLYFTRKNIDLAINITKVVSVMSLSLTVLFIGKIVQYDMEIRKITTSNVSLPVITLSSPVDSNSVNIVYIVLDEYTRKDRLYNELGFDNSQFIDNLSEMGFNVLKKSRSNYCFTPYSLASTNNLNYLDTLVFLNEVDDERWLKVFINQNSVVRFLRSQNYKVVSTKTSMFPGVHFSNSDLTIQNNNASDRLYDVSYSFWETTVFHPLLPYIYPDIHVSKSKKHRQRLDDGFKSLKHLDFSSDKTLVYAHFLTPHPPFVYSDYRQNNTKIGFYPLYDVRTMSDSIWLTNYLSQIKATNHRTIEMIRSLLNTENPPVIILQSDHGARKYLYLNKETNTYHSQFLMKYTNLSAIYFPDQDYSMLYDSMSNVNTWRVVLNKYFKTDLEMLPDRNFEVDPDNPFKFMDVTEKLDSIERTLK